MDPCTNDEGDVFLSDKGTSGLASPEEGKEYGDIFLGDEDALASQEGRDMFIMEGDDEPTSKSSTATRDEVFKDEDSDVYSIESEEEEEKIKSAPASLAGER